MFEIPIVPHIDPQHKIPIPPTAIRFHRFRKSIWGVASVNGQDYATLAGSVRQCRTEAWVHGRMFKVWEWKRLDQ